jgi:flagellar hook-length control protein FliK
MNLHFGTGNETMRRSLESSVASLVQALKQENIEITNVEVSRKSPIEKVRRMKGAH